MPPHPPKPQKTKQNKKPPHTDTQKELLKLCRLTSHLLTFKCN